MFGGDGNDRFIFRFFDDLTTDASTTDRIRDFERGERIDLQMDANPFTFGVENFRFVKDFSGAIGEVTIEKQGGKTVHVLGDLNGDSTADFLFVVSGVSSLGRSDFIL